jgi:hypothetical protein
MVVNELHKLLKHHTALFLKHLRPLEQLFTDPATVAQLILACRIFQAEIPPAVDCSGLVWAAYHACGHLCASDSDLECS